jgi:nitrate reductase gamma subunit
MIMTTTSFLYLILYAGVLVFIIACVVRAVGYARLPLHLRWELYPVFHEERNRAQHGGSYFEAPDWWTKSVPYNRLGELKAMVAEIFLLKALWEFKRRMWYRSYPFHLGLYLLIGTVGLLLPSALLSVVAPGLWAGGTGTILHYAYTFAGLVGAVLTLVGGAALLIERLTNEELKPYTTPGDIFNLSWFIGTVGLLLAGYLFQTDKTLSALAFTRGVLTFETSLKIPLYFEVGLLSGALLTAYVPMTHMSHFIAKYFTYHSVRWDDKPNRRGNEVERKLVEYLTYRPNWAASHVGADGIRSWVQVVTHNPAQGGKK